MRQLPTRWYARTIFERPEKHERLLFSMIQPEVAHAGPEIPPTISLSACWTDVTVADEGLDFVYLDAGHSYGSVKADLEAWYPKL
jgi:hypothetical protein